MDDAGTGPIGDESTPPGHHPAPLGDPAPGERRGPARAGEIASKRHQRPRSARLAAFSGAQARENVIPRRKLLSFNMPRMAIH
jgi:hypothetical protein